MGNKFFIIAISSISLTSCFSYEEPEYNPIRNVEDEKTTQLPNEEYKEGDDINLGQDWELYWSDEFDGGDTELDYNWSAENMSSAQIDCSRWRENAVVSDGSLKIVYKNEYKGGKEYTSASLISKSKFLYGYFEARYKYAAAYATNNSFWLMTGVLKDGKGRKFEVDINEGKYPNTIGTNLHDWSYNLGEADERIDLDGLSYGKNFMKGNSPIQQWVYETNESQYNYRYLKFESNQGEIFHMREFGIFSKTNEGYPDPMDKEAWETDKNRIDYTIMNTSNGDGKNINDCNYESGWIPQMDGPKYFEIDLGNQTQIGCIKFLTGYAKPISDIDNYYRMVSQYKIYGRNSEGEDWVEFSSKELTEDIDFSKEYHTFGLEWDENWLIFYCDRKELRRLPNKFVYSETPILLSGAVVDWAGELIPEQIHGSTMEVDYVRVYKRKGEIEENQ